MFNPVDSSQRIILACFVFVTALFAWLVLSLTSIEPVHAQTPKSPWRPADLLDAAADRPALVAELFRALSRPSDRIQLADGDMVAIEAQTSDTLLDLEFTGNVSVRAMVEPGQPDRVMTLMRAVITAYVPFERQALDQVNEFEKAARGLSALDRLTAQHSVLSAVLRFSVATRERAGKGPGRWEPLQTELDRKLLEVRRRLLQEQTAQARGETDWQRLVHFGQELVAAYPANATVLTDVARMRARYAAWLLFRIPAERKDAKEGYAAVRRQLEWVDQHLAEPPRADPVEMLRDVLLQTGPPAPGLYLPDALAVRQELVNRATGLWDKARKTKSKADALQDLGTAKEIWPRLPGLQDELLQRQGRYGKLYVGVRTLPRHLSPACASTDSEKQALELLFESLVQFRPTDDGGVALAPELAASLPQVAESTRRFHLRKAASWSTGARVTSADVQRTWELLTNPRLLGHSTELADQIEPIRGADSPFLWEAKLRQGLLDPLTPFSFKVLPRNYHGGLLASADDEAFALDPVGSGRFRLAGTHSENGRTYLRFVANPYFISTGDPIDSRFQEIREILFFVSSDPAEDFSRNGAPCHLLLDVPTQALSQLKAAGANDIRTMQTRRVTFLAVNHRNPILADEALRRALAHAINRRQVLADCFGGGRPAFRSAAIAAWGCTSCVLAAAMRPEGAPAHHTLNGPFPADSWASCPDNRVPPHLFDRAAAATFLKAAGSKQIELELKYPDDDPRIDEACKLIATQLAELGNHAGRPIVLRLVGLPPRQLQRDVLQHNYQLAWWQHDFANDSYALWPLFDPQEQALITGTNFLGFDDATLVELLQKAGNHRDFRKVKELTHLVHDWLYQRMPLIPLWQLDYHIAVHPDLKLPRVDPLRVFANVEEWRLAPR